MNSTENIEEGYRNGNSKTALEFLNNSYLLYDNHVFYSVLVSSNCQEPV